MTISSLVNSYALQYGIEPELIHSIIQHESGYKENAIREEPQINDRSVGLMQVLTGTAKMLGMTGDKESITLELKKPEINIKYGVKYLSSLSKQYNNIQDIIASYNAGRPKYNEAGQYINQKYVDKVMKTYKFLATVNDINKVMPVAFIGLAINIIANNLERGNKK